MPKRISKNQAALNREYLFGVQHGKSLTLLGIQLQLLRKKLNLSIEEVSKKTNVSVQTISDLESANLINAHLIYIDDLVALTRFYDCGAIVKFVSLVSGLFTDEDIVEEMRLMMDEAKELLKDNETISVTDHYKAMAEKDLEIFQLKQRLSNADSMAKSYMNEFAKRGLAYMPHSQTEQN